MTGISDVYKSAKQVYCVSLRWTVALQHLLPTFITAFLVEHLQHTSENEKNTITRRPKPLVDCRLNSHPQQTLPVEFSTAPDGARLRWGLLLPILSLIHI